MKTVSRPLTLIAAVGAALMALEAAAYQPGEMFLRSGMVTVAPDESSDGLAVPALAGVGSYPGGALQGTGVSVDSETQLGITATYMLNSSLGLELLAATPFTHAIRADLGGLGRVDAGETKHLPPTLSLVWYPLGSASRFAPYVGAGINYTLFFEEDVDADLENGLAAVADAVTGVSVGLASPTPLDLELKDSLGLALQAGFDLALDERWHLNASVRWIDIDTEATLSSGSATVIKVDDIELDPLVYQIGLGYRF